jgi:hypothetical protein
MVFSRFLRRPEPQIWRGRIAVALMAGISATAMSAEPGAPQTFEAFKIIVDRNMFDARRSPERPKQTERENTPRASRENLVLVGTMSYEKGDFAFFDGSNADFKKELKTGGRIGGLLVAEIGFAQVRLKSGDQQLELPVGTCLVREKGGPWKPGGKADDIVAPPAAAIAEVPPATAKDPDRSANAGKQFAADPDKSAKWAAKKLKKHAGDPDLESKEDKVLRKMLEGSFKDAPRKPGKYD